MFSATAASSTTSEAALAAIRRLDSVVRQPTPRDPVEPGRKEFADLATRLANLSARRTSLSFVSREALQDLHSDLPWQEAMAPDATLSASLSGMAFAATSEASGPSSGPLRLYAEWTARGVKVWIGADRSVNGADVLPLLQRWIALRGERLLSLVCNGRSEFEAPGADQSDSPQQPSVLQSTVFSQSFSSAGLRPATPSQENPWQPVP